ncbi:hypothetical protein C7212DRAFT_327469, partial [Tuber magnatum]
RSISIYFSFVSWAWHFSLSSATADTTALDMMASWYLVISLVGVKSLVCGCCDGWRNEDLLGWSDRAGLRRVTR